MRVLRFRVWVSGFRIQGVGVRLWVFGCRVQGLGFRVQGFGLRVGMMLRSCVECLRFSKV